MNKDTSFCKYPVKVVSNKTLKSTNVLKGGSGSDKNDVTGYKYPVYMGDLKEAVIPVRPRENDDRTFY